MSKYHILKYIIVLIILLSGPQFLLAQPYSAQNQLDLNNATFEEIQQLPVSAEIAERIYHRVLYKGDFLSIYELREIEGIDQEVLNQIKSLIRIEPFRPRTSLEENVEEMYYRLERWSGDEGMSDQLIDLWIEKSLRPHNVNTVTYEDLINLQNVSPIDAVAILNYRDDFGEIRNTRDLRNIPGLSYYGYRNARNFLAFETNDAVDPVGFHGRISTRIDNTPFFVDDDAASSQAGLGAVEQGLSGITANFLPNLFYRMRFSYNDTYQIGYSYVRNLGEPNYYTNTGELKIPSGKFYLGFENMEIGGIHVRKLYLGNYSVSFGQGVVMENVDFFIPRKSGFGYRKRFAGLSGDISRTREFNLNGVATELEYENLNATLFGSYTKRDAILNTQVYDTTLGRGFNQLVVLNQRFKYAPDDLARGPEQDNLSWLNSVNELTYGANLKYTFFPGTQIGLTFYESAYNKPLEPYINEIVSPENLGRLTNTDNEIRQAYGFDIAKGTNPFWNQAVSFRRVYGFDFQTVIENIVIQGEWGELDKGGSIFALGDDPKALVLSMYTQFNNLNVQVLYRNYDLGYDNPYQRSFSNYSRYKGTIYEDYYYLQSALYGQLYTNSPQPQAEEGYYLNTFYQINRNLNLRMEYDTWTRKADQIRQHRIVGSLDIRPIFPVRIQLRQKWQARDKENNISLGYFENFEFRGRMDIRLSGFDNLGILYMNSQLLVRPRPRVFGDMTPLSQALGAGLTHNFNNNLKISGFIAYYEGFFWNFEDTQFIVLDSQRGALRTWWSLFARLNHYFSFRIKYTLDHHKPMTNISFNDVRNPVAGQANSADIMRKNNSYFYLEFDYNF